jgi:hypothetical protein
MSLYGTELRERGYGDGLCTIQNHGKIMEISSGLSEVPNDRTEKIYEPWRLIGVDPRQWREESNPPQR